MSVWCRGPLARRGLGQAAWLGPAAWFGLTVALLALIPLRQAGASGLPVAASHPRLLLTPSIKAALAARVSAGDPSWASQGAADDVDGAA